MSATTDALVSMARALVVAGRTIHHLEIVVGRRNRKIARLRARIKDMEHGRSTPDTVRESAVRYAGHRPRAPIPAELDHVMDELARARSKHPRWPADPLHALAVLGEEYGELVQATMQTVYEGGKHDRVYAEATQTAAMAVRFLQSFNHYQWGASHHLKDS